SPPCALEIWLGGQISPPFFPAFRLKFLRASEKEACPLPRLPLPASIWAVYCLLRKKSKNKSKNKSNIISQI
ncbi:MAG: hypothetical protein KH010_26525, partial [Hungatella hathewayi]|nr:hypothetical protein [Hungatella hathewayi]